MCLEVKGTMINGELIVCDSENPQCTSSTTIVIVLDGIGSLCK